MKRILCIVQLPPPVHGVSMMNQLTLKAFNSEVNLKTKVIDYSFTKSISGIGKMSLNKIFVFLKHLCKVIYNISVFRPNAIYFTLSPVGSAFYRDAILVIIIRCIFRQEIIFHLHGKGIFHEMESSYFKYNIYNYVFKNTNVIHLSENLFDDIKLINTIKKKYVVPNGIKYFDFEKDKENRVNKIRILYLSNLIETKGVLILLEALKIIKDKGLNFECKFVGQTSNSITKEVFYSKLNTYDLDGYVEYCGPLYGQDKNKILAESEIFIFPTYKDCFPLVILEAMQAGLAIISTNEGAIPSILENCGVIVEKQSIEALVIAIERLVDSQQLRIELGLKAKKRFVTNYTLDKYKENILDTIKNILSI
ncbi:MAG: glycosyltransferase family 4 protein [Flavobacteriaceae bacterium]|nr:glycosyltransferase family 4 protein [Flavobacteriaceae bacterium]